MGSGKPAENPFDLTRRTKGVRGGLFLVELTALIVVVFVIGVVIGALLTLMESHEMFPAVTSSTWIAIGTLGVAIATAVTATHEALREHRSRTPNLQLVLMDSLHPRAKPSEAGGVVTVKNLGPGTARNVSVAFFAYPVDEPSRNRRREQGLDDAIFGGEERGSLEAGDIWTIQGEEFTGADSKLMPRLPVGHFYYEFQLEAETVFGSRVAPVRATLSRFQDEKDIGAGPIKVYRWRAVIEQEAQLARRHAEQAWLTYQSSKDIAPVRK